MGLRLSMLHEHSTASDRSTTTTTSRSSRRNSSKELKPFATDQGEGSTLYEASMQGPFPTYSVTEDYALSLELRKAGYKVGDLIYCDLILSKLIEVNITVCVDTYMWNSILWCSIKALILACLKRKQVKGSSLEARWLNVG